MLAHKCFAASYRSGETFGLVIYELQLDGPQKRMDNRRPEGRRHRDADAE